jgi:hypothetical protein
VTVVELAAGGNVVVEDAAGVRHTLREFEVREHVDE